MGHLRIHPYDWAVWTLRDFWLTYRGWKQVNITQPWQIARSISFITARSMGATTATIPEEFYSLSGEKRKIDKALLRPMTEEEKKLHEELIRGAANG